jgi:hypothetical protein
LDAFSELEAVWVANPSAGSKPRPSLTRSGVCRNYAFYIQLLGIKIVPRRRKRVDHNWFKGIEVLDRNDTIQVMKRDFEHPENWVLNTKEAALYLGISQTTLRRLRSIGEIPAFQVPSRTRGAKTAWRYRCLEMHAFVQENSGYERFARRFKPQLPIKAIADLLDVTIGDVKNQKWRGRLKDYRAASVRQYLLHTSRKSVSGEIRRHYQSELSRLRAEVRHYRRLIRSSRCERCQQVQVVPFGDVTATIVNQQDQK